MRVGTQRLQPCQGAAAALAAVAALTLGSVGPTAAAPAAGRAGCDGEVVARGRVAAVLDGRTLRLADGRGVRLAAIEAPAGAIEAPAGANVPSVPGARGAAALAALVAGQDITVDRLGETADRYGRVVGLVRVRRAGADHLVQEDLLAAGHAVVAARVGSPDCAARLLRAERTARAGLLGLWADPYYQTRDAQRPADILAGRGRFMLVEGTVRSVRASGGTIYVNFGPRYSRDFAVAVSKRKADAFAAAGMALPSLTGRRVRVRGVIEARGGPRVYVVAPEQIEIIGSN